MADTYAEKKQEEKPAITLDLQTIPRKTLELDKTTDRIANHMSGKAAPIIVKIGNIKEAENVANRLSQLHEGRFITSVTRGGDLKILNADAAAQEMEDRIKLHTSATTLFGNTQETLGIASRLKKMGYVTTIENGYLRGFDANSVAAGIPRSMKYESRAKMEVGNTQEAEAVARIVNEKYEGRFFASVAEGGKINVLNVESTATHIKRSIQYGNGVQNVEVGTRREAEEVAKAFNNQYSDKFIASPKNDGSLDIKRI